MKSTFDTLRAEVLRRVAKPGAVAVLVRPMLWKPGRGLTLKPGTPDAPHGLGVGVVEGEDKLVAVLWVARIDRTRDMVPGMDSALRQLLLSLAFCTCLTPLPLVPGGDLALDADRVQVVGAAPPIDLSFDSSRVPAALSAFRGVAEGGRDHLELALRDYAAILADLAAGLPPRWSGFEILERQEARDATLGIALVAAASLPDAIDREYWLDLERSFVALLRPDPAPRAVGYLEWLDAVAGTSTGGSRAAVPAGLIAAAAHRRRLAQMMAHDPPLPDDPLFADFATLLPRAVATRTKRLAAAERLALPGRSVPEQQQRQAAPGGLPIPSPGGVALPLPAEMPDLEDLDKHLPPCMKTAIDGGRAAHKMMNDTRRFCASFLVSLGYGPTDVPSAVRFLVAGGDGTQSQHDLEERIRRARPDRVFGCRKHRETVPDDKTKAFCPYDHSRDCAAAAGFSRAPTRPADYVVLSIHAS